MRLASGTAPGRILAGFAIIIFGTYLGYQEIQLRKQLKQSLETPQTPDPAAVPTPFDPSEYVKQLAELAKNLAALPQATQAFLTATLLFFFAAAIAIADKLVAQ